MSSILHAAPVLLVFGDSLSAGYGVPQGQGWVALLEKQLAGRYQVVNASISGETTAGGRSRLDDALHRFKPAVVVIALGANDGLRGLSLAAMRANLAAMVRTAKGSGARVLLAGMKLPPNYGSDYVIEFERSFATVARQEKCALLPFLLEPVATDPAAFQADGLHPVAAAQPLVLDHVWKALAPLLR